MFKYCDVKTHFCHSLNKSTMYLAHYTSITLITVTTLSSDKHLILHKLSNSHMWICVLFCKLDIGVYYNSLLDKMLSSVYYNDVNIDFVYNMFKDTSRIDGSFPFEDTG